MENENLVAGLHAMGKYLSEFLEEPADNQSEKFGDLQAVMHLAEQENPWFTQDNIRLALGSFAESLAMDLRGWLSRYHFRNSGKRVGLILAGNIPFVGFHDVLCVLLSGNIPLIKPSSKDRRLPVFLLKKLEEFSGKLPYEFVEKLEGYDAVIATGSNNTASYLESYFRTVPHIIRSNRTSVAVLTGHETDEDLRHLGEDIFSYFGLGCRNVTRLLLPGDFVLDRLFENFLEFKNIINHHKYANNYDYNKAIYLLNQDLFWDNNFVMLREEDRLFSPLAVINFSRYRNIEEVEHFLEAHQNEIQCVVAQPGLLPGTVAFGQAQHPPLDAFADGADTLAFLSNL